MIFDSPEMLLGLILVLGIVAVGLTIWVLRYVMRGNRAQRTEAEAPRPAEIKAAAVKVSEGSAVTPESTPPAAPARQPMSQPGDTLLMRIWRDREGFLVVETGGQRYRRLFDIRDGERGRQVLEVINRLDAFAKGQVSQIAPPEVSLPNPPVVSLPNPPPEKAGLAPEAAVEERSQAFLEKLQQPETPAPKKTLLTADPVPFRRVNEAQMPSITLNLAGEIDSLLQIRVKASPEFKDRYLRVANTLDGGLRFEVDGARYSTIDEIPEPPVQKIIKAAIADWEAKR